MSTGGAGPSSHHQTTGFLNCQLFPKAAFPKTTPLVSSMQHLQRPKGCTSAAWAAMCISWGCLPTGQREGNSSEGADGEGVRAGEGGTPQAFSPMAPKSPSRQISVPDPANQAWGSLVILPAGSPSPPQVCNRLWLMTRELTASPLVVCGSLVAGLRPTLSWATQ